MYVTHTSNDRYIIKIYQDSVQSTYVFYVCYHHKSSQVMHALLKHKHTPKMTPYTLNTLSYIKNSADTLCVTKWKQTNAFLH